jgi:hypothetical protein
MVKKPASFGWRTQLVQCRKKAVENGYCKECASALQAIKEKMKKDLEQKQRIFGDKYE